MQLKKSMVISSTPLFFMISSKNGGLGAKEKMKLTFSWSPLKYILYGFFKFSSILHALVVLGYLPKLRRGMQLVFCADFLYSFHKNVSF